MSTVYLSGSTDIAGALELAETELEHARGQVLVIRSQTDIPSQIPNQVLILMQVYNLLVNYV